MSDEPNPQQKPAGERAKPRPTGAIPRVPETRGAADSHVTDEKAFFDATPTQKRDREHVMLVQQLERQNQEAATRCQELQDELDGLRPKHAVLNARLAALRRSIADENWRDRAQNLAAGGLTAAGGVIISVGATLDGAEWHVPPAGWVAAGIVLFVIGIAWSILRAIFRRDVLAPDDAASATPAQEATL